ncbi:MAG TPA: hypothetical protein VHM70_12940 [Polyangiaceae bacterium]|jgi:tetratricopeptide (TPR) repeat protein|nr:hypothetical protein [Polyangiaceae bacterium]
MFTINSNTASALFQARERLYATGYAALAERNLDLALEAFGLMAAVSPFEERPWIGLGAAHEQNRNWSAAAGFYRMGRSVAGHSVWPLIGEARALAALGRRAEAEGLLEQALELTSERSIAEQIENLRGQL